MPNSVTVTGNTSKKGCELRFTPSGAAAANFSVAGTNRYFSKERNEFVDDGEPLWFNVTAWRELAEQVAEQIGTNDGSKKVTVTGRLKARKYTPKDGGDEREVWDLIADSVCVHPPRPGSGGARDTGWANQEPPQTTGRQGGAPGRHGDPWAGPTGPGWVQPQGDSSAPPF